MIMGLGLMHRHLRMVFSLLSVSVAFSLAGCGFVNVTNLTPTVKKTFVLVVGSSEWLRNSQIVDALASAPQGVSTVSLSTSGVAIASLIKQINDSTANAIIMIQPNAALMKLPATHPQVHFYVIGKADPVVVPNVSVLAPDNQQLASVAGYIAGSSAVRGQPLYVVSAAPTESPAMASVVDAVYSGAHAAFSTGYVQWSGQFTSTAKLSQGIYVIWGTIPSANIAAIAVAKQKVIAVGSQNDLTGMTVVANYSATGWVASSVQSALHAIYQQHPLPAVSSIPISFQVNVVPSWQQKGGILDYERMIATGTLSPTGFLQGIPSVKTAQLLHLPIPPNILG